MTPSLSEKAAVKFALLRLQGKDATAFLGLVELCDALLHWHEEYVVLSWKATINNLARLEADNGKGVVKLDQHNPVWKDTLYLLRKHPTLASLVSPSWTLFRVHPSDYSLFFIGSEKRDKDREIFPEPIAIL